MWIAGNATIWGFKTTHDRLSIDSHQMAANHPRFGHLPGAFQQELNMTFTDEGYGERTVGKGLPAYRVSKDAYPSFYRERHARGA